MALFDGTEEHPPSKVRRYIITGLTFVILVVLGCWYLLRFHQETTSVKNFLNTVASGNFDLAYQMWKPAPSFSFKDFMEDWGPNSYYGPVKSYSILKAKSPTGSTTSVEVRIAISPYSPMPTANNDPEKSQKTKVVNVWVDTKDKSFSFPP